MGEDDPNLEEIKGFQTQYASVNINRLCIAKFMLRGEQMDYNHVSAPLTLKRGLTTKERMNKRTTKREKSREQGERYFWRCEFPHCKNIYADKDFPKVQDGKEIKFKETNHSIFKDQKDGNIFREQGIVFVSDPFDPSLYQSKSYKEDLTTSVRKYWESKVKVADIDDLCDSFLLKFDFKVNGD